MASSVSSSLLIEFLTEELPPINLEVNIGNCFAAAVYEELKGFLGVNTTLQSFVSARRFGCILSELNLKQADQVLLRKGPALVSAFKEGLPTPALLGFAKSCGCEWQSLEQREDGYCYAEVLLSGKELAQVLPEVINRALKKIPIAKTMRWGDNDYQFIRPVHNLVVMLDEQLVACQAFGLAATVTTRGHRFMCNTPIRIRSAAEYLLQMEQEGRVVAEFAARRARISQQLADQAGRLGLTISHIDGLLDEVCALVEWPEVLLGKFAEKFLAVPQECLILSMAKNQKYFALLDKHGKLTNQFLFVTNLISKDSSVIIAGNEKVLSARLADAEFFYEFDKRTALVEFVPKMAAVVYHNKLGSQLERTERLQQIAARIAPYFGLDINVVKRCAYLLKADLVTEMVGEFPELQGIMGNYYAQASGESAELALAIEQHYYPRFSGDKLPESSLALVMSLADKLESIVGIWGIGLIPSGDKDPYGLRRAALGVIRILLEQGLDLKQLLEHTAEAFKDKNLAKNSIHEVYQFMLQRLANYLASSENYPTKVVNSVLSSGEFDFKRPASKTINHLTSLLKALLTFADDQCNQPLFQANKRIENILKKNETELVVMPVAPDLFSEDAEIALYDLFNLSLAGGERLASLKEQQDWNGYFRSLAEFNLPLEQFFATVMVMADEPAVRQNRLNLLKILHTNFNLLCQLSELA